MIEREGVSVVKAGINDEKIIHFPEINVNKKFFDMKGRTPVIHY